MTRWRVPAEWLEANGWPPALGLTVTADTTDPETLEQIEAAAARQGIPLKREDTGEVVAR